MKLPLARKYRPSNFSELVGQEMVKRALENSIRTGRVLHNVIFTGVRGTGKTTLARLYAKCLVCEHALTLSPCGSCEACVAVAQSNHEDVMEIDGASNTSVDDVRALRETVSYAPQRGSYKVYIIDEVHMLSQSAFNALLKTLEEPPAHVSFLFATTELHKIPQTILSRCQVFHLQKFSSKAVYDHLTHILASEGIKYDPEALQVAAAQGRGSLRDALTFLDQVIISSSDGSVNRETVELLTGGLPVQLCMDLLKGLLGKDGKRVISVLAAIDAEGNEWPRILDFMAKLCRFCFVSRELSLNHPILEGSDIPQQQQEELAGLGKSSPLLDLNRLFRVIVSCRKNLDGSDLDKLICENHFLEWCLDPGLPTIKDFLFGASKTKQEFIGREDNLAKTPAPTIMSPSHSAESKPTDLQRGVLPANEKSTNSLPENIPVRDGRSSSNSLNSKSPYKPDYSRILD